MAMDRQPGNLLPPPGGLSFSVHQARVGERRGWQLMLGTWVHLLASSQAPVWGVSLSFLSPCGAEPGGWGSWGLPPPSPPTVSQQHQGWGPGPLPSSVLPAKWPCQWPPVSAYLTLLLQPIVGSLFSLRWKCLRDGVLFPVRLD